MSALRAQGDLNKERRKVLNDLSSVLNVSVERHKTEVRRAVNDEFLTTVANRINGSNADAEWTREGRRIIPLMRRGVPLTHLTDVADKASKDAKSANKNLLPPFKTKSSKSRTASSSSTCQPPALKDIVSPETGFVKPPSFATPRRSTSSAGDVVVLPSGMAVRFKEETLTKAEQRRRKRKANASADDENATRGSIEVLPPGVVHLPSSQHPGYTASGAKRRRQKQYHQQQNVVGLNQHHGYARHYLPQVPSPMHDLSSTSQKVIVVSSTASAAATSVSNLVNMPQLPNTPVAVSPSKLNSGPPAPNTAALTAVAKRISSSDNDDGSRSPTTPPASTSTTKTTTASPAVATTTIQLKDGTLAQGMRVIPAGARILPKPGVAGGAAVSSAVLASPTAGTPVYMVTTSGAAGQNVMRVARAALPAGSGSAASTEPTTSTTQRVVTMSTAALRTAGGQTIQVRPAVGTPGTPGLVKGATQRVFTTTTAAAAGLRPGTPNRPSVIVVQRTPISAKGATLTGQRMLYTKNGKPLVFMSKNPVLASGAAGSTVMVPAGAVATLGEAENKPNEEKSEEEQQQPQTADEAALKDKDESEAVNRVAAAATPNNMLSDILAATGIFTTEAPKAAESGGESENAAADGNGEKKEDVTDEFAENEVDDVEPPQLTVNDIHQEAKPADQQVTGTDS